MWSVYTQVADNNINKQQKLYSPTMDLNDAIRFDVSKALGRLLLYRLGGEYWVEVWLLFGLII
jgi:hypothetical protein